LNDAGIDYKTPYVAYSDPDYSFASGKKAASELLLQSEPPTAIFCISDILALGVIAQAEENGLHVPDDLSVVGFDDVDYTTMFHPNLTTVAVPCYELGSKSMLMLQKYIQKIPGAEEEVYLPHKLKIRESCAQKTAI
jgi:DNA-binding LacI/PurR family transcriptional regulator